MSESETFEYAGCQVELVDAAGILAAAAAHPVALLHGAQFPRPVREVRAARLVDGVTTVAAKAYQKMGWRWVAPEAARGAGRHHVAVLEDAAAGLRASVSYDEAGDLSGRTILARWGAQRPQGILLYGPPGTGVAHPVRPLRRQAVHPAA